MTFLMVLLALVIERFFHWGHLRYWRWFKGYQNALSTRVSAMPSWLVLVVCVVPPVLLVGFVDFILKGWLYGLLQGIFGLLVLLYCLGPKNFWVQAYACINELHKDDPELAVKQVQTDFAIEHPESSQAFHHSFTKAIFRSSYHRIFSVVFWFVLLGPMGAVLYRLLNLSAMSSTLGVSSLASVSVQYLDWLPIRLYTFLFALGGHFTEVITAWKKWANHGVQSNDILLVESGIAALDVTESGRIPEDGTAEKEAIAMIDRVFVIALFILAMIILAF